MRKPLEKIKVSAGEDLLAFIPHMMGYWPENSIVCIGMNGKRLRATMRLDLPEDNSPDTARFAAIAAAQLSSDDEANGCLIAIFGREDWADSDYFPQSGVYKDLCAAFAGFELPVRDAWYVGPNYWRSLHCTNAHCCPWPGTSNVSIKESFVNAEFIFRGSMVRKNPKEQIQELITVQDAGFAESVVVAGEELRDHLATNGSGARQLAASLGAWEFSLKCWPKTPDAVMAAFLLASLAEVGVRDVVIVALATSAGGALAGAAGVGLVLPDTEEIVVPRNWYGGNQAAGCPVIMGDVSDKIMMKASRDFSNILIGDIPVDEYGQEAAGPDWVRLGRAEALLHFLATCTDHADKAPVLCLLGWIQWCKGRGTWAGHYFQTCQQYQPGYRLASMLDELLSVGYIAECAKNPRTAWHENQDEISGDRDEANRQDRSA